VFEGISKLDLRGKINFNFEAISTKFSVCFLIYLDFLVVIHYRLKEYINNNVIGF